MSSGVETSLIILQEYPAPDQSNVAISFTFLARDQFLVSYSVIGRETWSLSGTMLW